MISIRDSKVYGNCKMLAPDGTLLCRCHYDKVEWYVSRGLGDLVETEPHPTVRLNFIPNGMGHADEAFYTQEKKNECVVCGVKDGLTKHHCVPACFRKCMPVDYKENTSHDILPVCFKCHMKYEPSAQELKDQIAERLGIPFHPHVVVDELEWRAFKAAGALLLYKQQMPDSRVQELYQRIKDSVGHDDITQEVLESLIENSPYKTGEKSSQSIIDKTDDLDAFIVAWRQHFVDIMQPRFLPEHWRVDFVTKRPSGDKS